MIEGHIYTEGIIKRDYAETLKNQIASLSPDVEVIIHHISSPGGDVYAAWKPLPELMKIGKPVKSIIEGEASSIASWIAVAPAYEVESTDPSTAMIHEPFFPDGIQSSLGVDDLETAKVELSQIRQSMAECYAKKSGRPVDEWLAIMKKNTRMTAQMLKAHGLVDKITPIEPRKIAAEFLQEIKQDFNNFKIEVMNIFNKKPIVVAQVTALDLPLKGGKVLKVDSENGDLVGKPASIDGAPANGSYPAEDGRTIVCVDGKVTAVEQADPQEDAASKIQQLEAQLKAIKAAEEAKTAAENEAKRLAAEQAEKDKLAAEVKEKEIKIAAMAKEMEELRKKTVGDDSAPNKGGSPFAIGSKQDNDFQMGLRASRSFIAENFPHWEQQFYPNGKFKDGKKFSDYRRGGPEAVSLIETNFNYTWNGTLDIKSLFYTKTLSSPALSDIFTVDTGSAHNKRYHIIPALNNVVKPYTGCDQTVTGSSVNITSKNIQLKPFQVLEKFCKDDFTDQLTGIYNVLAQEWLKTGNDSFDPAGTPIDRIIMDLLKDAIRRDTFRRASFADTSSASANYNQIDGLVTTLIDQAGASNYCVYREGAALGIGTLATNTASARFEAMYNNSPLLLKEHVIDSGVGKFLVTRSMWENYYTTLVGVGAVTEQAYSDYKSGVKTLEFRGIPVVPVTIWDSFLAEPTNPLFATTRHLAILTTKDNHILGVENTADMLTIKSWFEEKDNARYYRNNMTMGVLGAILCDLTTIAY